MNLFVQIVQPKIQKLFQVCVHVNTVRIGLMEKLLEKVYIAYCFVTYKRPIFKISDFLGKSRT